MQEMGKLLAEQQAYYVNRAPEYDEWWERKGRYDLGPEGNKIWWDEVAEVIRFFETIELGGKAVDIAAGTGYWTEFLAGHGADVTAVDGSEEVLAINRQRLQKAGLIERVKYQQVDLFGWSETERYDVAFMGFWISHIPEVLMDPFFAHLSSALTAGGKVLLVDSQSRSDNPERGTQTLSEEIQIRTLKDGRQSRIVKKFHSPGKLTDLLARHGIDATIKVTSEYFVYGMGTKDGSQLAG